MKKEDLNKKKAEIKNNKIIKPRKKAEKNETLEEEYKKITNNKTSIIALIIGIIIGLTIMACAMPDRIATLKDGTQAIVEINGQNITANELYTKLNSSCGLNTLLDLMDKKILEEKYKEDAEMISSVTETEEYWIDIYDKNYGLSEDEFLEQNGFSSEDEFIEYLKLDYRRELYYKEYMKNIITEEEINEYYEESIFGDIDTKYISLSTSDKNKKILEEILEKLENGATYDSLKDEYEEVTFKTLGYIKYSDSTDTNYLEELRKLENNTYSNNIIETSYGYTIVFRGEDKEKDTLKNTKEFIITKLTAKLETDDPYIKNKALIKLRKNSGIKFSDTEMEKKYNSYCENIQSK